MKLSPDQAAYERYKKFCENLGITPCQMADYLKSTLKISAPNGYTERHPSVLSDSK